MSNLYLDSDMFIELVSLKDASGENVADADVTVTLEFANGTEVGGQVWPTTLDYDPETSSYKGSFSSDLNVREGSKLVAKIVAEVDNRKATFQRNLTVIRNEK